MREIKFRIWMKSLNRMVYNPYVQEVNKQERDQINDYFNGNNNKFIWMQYTGLKDKNSKEIYEGDILSDSQDTREVKFGNGSFYLCPNTQALKLMCNTFVIKGIYEVIGNIYENTSLVIKR